MYKLESDGRLVETDCNLLAEHYFRIAALGYTNCRHNVLSGILASCIRLSGSEAGLEALGNRITKAMRESISADTSSIISKFIAQAPEGVDIDLTVGKYVVKACKNGRIPSIVLIADGA